MGDNAAIIVLIIIFLVHSFKMQSLMKIWIATLTIFIWFVGLGIRGYSMVYVFRSDKVIISIILINFFMEVVRSFLLFFCIPLTCKQ